MPFLFRKLTSKIHKTEKRQENHQRANMIKLWNKLSKPAAKRFDSSCIFLAGTSFSFAGFLSYNFWVFECNHFHLNIANDSTNNSLGQSNKFTKHSLHFVTPKTENFIEEKKGMRNLEISPTFNHGILPFHHANKSNEYQNFGSKQTNNTSLNHHLNRILCFVAGLKQKTWVD